MGRATQGHLLLLELPRAGGSAPMTSSLETEAYFFLPWSWPGPGLPHPTILVPVW